MLRLRAELEQMNSRFEEEAAACKHLRTYIGEMAAVPLRKKDKEAKQFGHTAGRDGFNGSCRSNNGSSAVAHKGERPRIEGVRPSTEAGHLNDVDRQEEDARTEVEALKLQLEMLEMRIEAMSRLQQMQEEAIGYEPSLEEVHCTSS